MKETQTFVADGVTHPTYERRILQRCVMKNDQGDKFSLVDQSDVAAKSTDAAVRHALVEGRHQILKFLRRRLGDPEAAEDVLQTFMLRAIDRSEQLRDVRAVRGWLSQILASSIADHGRKVSRQRQREVVMAPTDLEGVHHDFDEELDEVICNCLYKLLPTLKPEYAEVIWRVDLQEQPREDVAKDLGITLNNLNVRVHRGRQALKTRLQQMCLTCPVHGFRDCDCDAAEKVRARLEGLADESEI
jgi:RNA polymerase sigma-70 factor (ECF subfamily)